MLPIGRGQRGLIVSPPKAGKTMLLKHIAKGMKLCVCHMLQHAENNMRSARALKQAVSGKGGRQ